MKKVKCKYCKKVIDREKAYINEKLSSNFNVVKEYYCSEQCFKNKLEGKKAKEEKIKEISDFRKTARNEFRNILDISLERNVYFTNLYNDLEKTYGSNVIMNYLKHEKGYLINTINSKCFDTNYAKIKYFFTIVQNNIDKYVIEENTSEIREINRDLIDDFDLCTPIETNKKKRSLSNIMKGV